jgi:Putative MetA-pathway of phenol degradation
VLNVSYQYSSGDIVTDPSLPVTGVESKLNLALVGYQRTFSLFGRTANAQFNLPYSWGTSEGFLNDEFLSVDTIGYGDARARLSVNLRGAPAMDIAGFQALTANPETIVGVSLLIQAPTGTYNPDKYLNTSANRWAVKPAVGVIWPLHPTWLLEAELGTWFFGDNDEFVGATRAQEPILSSEFHLVKRVGPSFWASLDANFYVGGRTIVDEVKKADLQRNSRFGFTFYKSLARHHALRGSYSTGLVTASGGDYSIIALSYIAIW